MIYPQSNGKITQRHQIRKCIEQLLTQNWSKSQWKTHRVGLYFYDDRVVERVHPVEYTERMTSDILSTFDGIKLHRAESVNHFLAIRDMVDTVEAEGEHMDDVASHRILFFCSKSSGNSKSSALSAERLQRLREKLGGRGDIILECIQVSGSSRPNTDLKELCETIKGEYWKLSCVMDSDIHLLRRCLCILIGNQ